MEQTKFVTWFDFLIFIYYIYTVINFWNFRWNLYGRNHHSSHPMKVPIHALYIKISESPIKSYLKIKFYAFWFDTMCNELNFIIAHILAVWIGTGNNCSKIRIRMSNFVHVQLYIIAFCSIQAKPWPCDNLFVLWICWPTCRMTGDTYFTELRRKTKQYLSTNHNWAKFRLIFRQIEYVLLLLNKFALTNSPLEEKWFKTSKHFIQS